MTFSDLHRNITNHGDKEQGCGVRVESWDACSHNWHNHRQNWNYHSHLTQSLLRVAAHSPLDGAGEGLLQAKVTEAFSP